MCITDPPRISAWMAAGSFASASAAAAVAAPALRANAPARIVQARPCIRAAAQRACYVPLK